MVSRVYNSLYKWVCGQAKGRLGRAGSGLLGLEEQALQREPVGDGGELSPQGWRRVQVQRASRSGAWPYDLTASMGETLSHLLKTYIA